MSTNTETRSLNLTLAGVCYILAGLGLLGLSIYVLILLKPSPGNLDTVFIALMTSVSVLCALFSGVRLLAASSRKLLTLVHVVAGVLFVLVGVLWFFFGVWIGLASGFRPEPILALASTGSILTGISMSSFGFKLVSTKT